MNHLVIMGYVLQDPPLPLPYRGNEGERVERHD